MSTTIVPGGYENVAGNSDNCIPFGCTVAFGNRYQQVYDVGAFDGTSGYINSLAFRLSTWADLSPTFSDYSFDLIVNLATTTAASDSISPFFATNVAFNSTTVFAGSINWSGVQKPGPIVNDFDLIINFDQSFAFNGTQNLLLDLTIVDKSVSPVFYLDAVWNTGPFGRAYGPSNSDGERFTASYGLITQFEFGPKLGVAEPSAAWLLAMGLLALLAMQPKRAIEHSFE